MAGEYCDWETKIWAEKAFKVPVLNNWWQSETGHPITALCLGYGHNPWLPKNSTGPPIPGYNGEPFSLPLLASALHCIFLWLLVEILREDASKAAAHELGKIAIKLPLPPGCVSTLFQADDRFVQTYFSTYSVSFLESPRGRRALCHFISLVETRSRATTTPRTSATKTSAASST